ncbi:hypothetical protein MLD38_020275 [Melastoma candidum]|uniref:Uncharacterized protein n=1 Tax=Melastoma candidum TaxID=119954 RepID=A0ACB9QG67_9MYRT|nr:hypothetical protein MLD38_020275 [Melastoma candidum]
MVFSSFPSAYLDPSHWQQQQQQQQNPSSQPEGSSGCLNPCLHPHQLQPHPPQPPPPPPPLPNGPVSGGTNIRPRSMAERARLANIPMPEAALKCPRCESTNTKFCYFNNYNLSQPRHFCKTCRRYWTKGGALRSVPVGGGCRRTKRTKSSGSKKMDKRSTTSASGGSVSNTSGSNNMLGTSDGSVAGNTAELLGLMSQIPSLGFISPMHQADNHQLGEFTSSKFDPGYGGIPGQPLEGISGDLNFQFGEGGDGSHSSGRNCLLSAVGTGGIEQWRAQQFPYMGNQDMQAGLYPMYERGAEPSTVMTRPPTSGLPGSQPASMKTESGNDNNNQVEWNMSRRLAGIQRNGMFWGTSGSAWTDHSGFGSSSIGNNDAM